MKRRSINRLLLIFTVSLVLAFTHLLIAQTPTAEAATEKEKAMAVDATPDFLVAAIRPSDPNATEGWTFESEGHHIMCKRTTVIDILSVAYGVQVRQIVGGNTWLRKDRYDITGVPDVPGVPNVTQLRGMYQKLLAERFHLALHREMREMPIYALTVAKGGPNLKIADPNETHNAGNSGDASQRVMKFTNISMKDLATNLDLYEDRPVVDQTGLQGRYDFTLKWARDISAEASPGAPPSLFTAIREQLGLKLDAVKGQAEVVAIDHVERPSEN